MSNYIPYNQNQSYQSTQYFPQPQGNVYLVNNSLEVANIPMGAGFSVVLCPAENTMYIKTFQGGSPTLMVYSIKPYEQKTNPSTTEKQPAPQEGQALEEQVAKLSQAVDEIKKQLGGQKINDLL